MGDDEKKHEESHITTGLTDSQVKTLRQQFGYNEIRQKKTPLILLLLRKFWGISSWMLELTILFSFLLHKNFDGYVVIVLLIFNAIIGFINEYKAAKTVEALQQKLEIMVRVLRHGEWVHLPSKELVPGDVLRIRTGDLLTADMNLAEGKVKVDKSALTGETALVEESSPALLYAGSVVKSGEGTAVVTATATSTFFGKTAQLVMTAHHRLHMEDVVVRVVRMLFIAVVGILIITTLVGLWNGQTLISIMPLILILLVTAVPIGLPAMFTISMARGAKELSEDGLLVSRLSATEDAATLSTLCIDKTGTITKNELTLQEIVCMPGFTTDEVVRYGLKASVRANEDSIDLAFFNYAEKNPDFEIRSYQQISFTPFSAETKRTEAVIELGNDRITVTKGAYITIKELCKLSGLALDNLVDTWAHKGFKTIAVAVAKEKLNFEFAGIVALYDPPRPDAARMLQAIKQQGIDIKMLTGDALPIGIEIARQTGIGENIVSISEVRENLKSEKSAGTIYQHNGFAEVLPEDKFDIVKKLQQENQIVGMTGDGVNDAPALKQAEVGIAVKNATDVARQAASIILLKEGLQQILNLIKVGRSIHVRITNYTVNKISKTILTILFVCTSFIITRQFVVSAFDMVLMLFLVDFAVLALAVDKVRWSRKPATWNIKPLVIKGILLGTLIFIESTGWFFFAKEFFHIQDSSRIHSLGFASLFFSTIISVMIIRTDKYFFREPVSRTLLFVVIGDIALVMILLNTGLTGFSKLDWVASLSTLLFAAISNLLINDTIKVYAERYFQKRPG